MSNPYSELLYANPHLCCTLGSISSSNLNYANPSFWADKEILFPRHNWNMHIVAVWNTAARLCLNH